MSKKEIDTKLAKAGERFDKFSSSGSLLHSIVTATKPNEADPYNRESILARVDRGAKSGAKALKQAIDAFGQSKSQ